MSLGRRTFLEMGAAAGVGLIGTFGGARPLETGADVADAVDQGSGVLRYTLSPTASTARTTAAQGPTVAVVESDPFELLGMTWDRGEPAPAVQVRVRTGSAWSDWHELGSGHEPDDVSRPGTDPLWVGRADAAEVRVTAEDGVLPAGLSLDLVRPSEASVSDEEVETTATTTSAVSYPRPTMRSRASWGADESLRRNQDGVWYGEVRGAFVHHTATSNSYSSSEVPAILRSIYRYHVLSREFLDIGYNFLIDRFGRIWEGAYGGVSRPVVGAHTQYYNSHSFGVSAIGSFQLVQPPSAMLLSYQRLIAWKFVIHEVYSPYGDARYTNDGARPLPKISGHRDTKSTTCPGGYLYSQLSTIRKGVHTRATAESTLRVSGPPIAARGARTTLTIRWTVDGASVSGLVNLQRRTSSGWEHVRQVAVEGGRATMTIYPGASNSYRLRISSSETPGVDTRDPRGTSNTLSIRVVRPGDDPELRLVGPSSVDRGERTNLQVYWASGDGPVTGLVNLQRRTSGSWQHVRQFAISDGHVTHAIFPGGSNTYRIRASRATSPSGVSTAQPEGTSNSLSIRVT